MGVAGEGLVRRAGGAAQACDAAHALPEHALFGDGPTPGDMKILPPPSPTPFPLLSGRLEVGRDSRVGLGLQGADFRGGALLQEDHVEDLHREGRARGLHQLVHGLARHGAGAGSGIVECAGLVCASVPGGEPPGAAQVCAGPRIGLIGMCGGEAGHARLDGELLGGRQWEMLSEPAMPVRDFRPLLALSRPPTTATQAKRWLAGDRASPPPVAKKTSSPEPEQQAAKATRTAEPDSEGAELSGLTPRLGALPVPGWALGLAAVLLAQAVIFWLSRRGLGAPSAPLVHGGAADLTAALHELASELRELRLQMAAGGLHAT